MSLSQQLRKTELDFLQITDTNCYEYIQLIKRYRGDARFLIEETNNFGAFNISNIININDLRNYNIELIQQLILNETEIIERINTIDTDEKKGTATLEQVNQRIKFKIMKKLYYYMRQAFIKKLEWVNLQYDDLNNLKTITNLEILTIKGEHWVANLEHALIKAREYKNLLSSPQKTEPDDDLDLAGAQRLPPLRTPPNPETSLASSMAARRRGRSDMRSASRRQRPRGGGMATRKKLYRKRNKRQIKRYTKKYCIRY